MVGVVKVERVQLGVRMERRLVKVLKGLAEFNDESLGELLERIVLHSFQPVPGDEGESCASPHGPSQLEAIGMLRKTYKVPGDVHAPREWATPPGAWVAAEASRPGGVSG